MRHGCLEVSRRFCEKVTPVRGAPAQAKVVTQMASHGKSEDPGIRGGHYLGLWYVCTVGTNEFFIVLHTVRTAATLCWIARTAPRGV